MKRERGRELKQATERQGVREVYSELPWTKLDLLHDGSTATLQFRMLISQPALQSPSLRPVSPASRTDSLMSIRVSVP